MAMAKLYLSRIPPLSEYKVCIRTTLGGYIDVVLNRRCMTGGIVCLLRDCIFRHDAKYLAHIVHSILRLSLHSIPKRPLRISCLGIADQFELDLHRHAQVRMRGLTKRMRSSFSFSSAAEP